MKDDHGATFFIVTGVKPVSELERFVRMGFVSGTIWEMVNGDGYIVSRIQVRQILVACHKIRSLGDLDDAPQEGVLLITV